MAPTIQSIFQQYGDAYLEMYGKNMPSFQKRAMNAIITCRTGNHGIAEYRCESCSKHHKLPRSCGNRHCPQCQGRKAYEWSERQVQKRLPGNHFMIVFTVPEALRRFLRSNQRVGYNALFSASSETIKAFASDGKTTKGIHSGFWGVLHTWGRQLQYHPHIHYIVPGGTLSLDHSTWCKSQPLRFADFRAMSKVFRGKFRALMHKEGLYDQIPSSVWRIDWNVNIQAVGEAQESIRYLARYVFKVAISDSRILKLENDTVTFSYTKSGSRRRRKMSLPVFKFMHRFLQHALPKGLVKVRHYGFCHPSSKIDMARLKTLVELAYAFQFDDDEEDAESDGAQPMKCPSCGHPLTYVRSQIPTRFGPRWVYPKQKELLKTG